jgi:hypothetical protein
VGWMVGGRRQWTGSRRRCGSGGMLVMSWLVLWWRVMYRWWRLVMVIPVRLVPAGWRGTIVPVLVLGRGRSVRGRRTGLWGVIMM